MNFHTMTAKITAITLLICFISTASAFKVGDRVQWHGKSWGGIVVEVGDGDMMWVECDNGDKKNFYTGTRDIIDEPKCPLHVAIDNIKLQEITAANQGFVMEICDRLAEQSLPGQQNWTDEEMVLFLRRIKPLMSQLVTKKKYLCTAGRILYLSCLKKKEARQRTGIEIANIYGPLFILPLLTDGPSILDTLATLKVVSDSTREFSSGELGEERWATGTSGKRWARYINDVFKRLTLCLDIIKKYAKDDDGDHILAVIWSIDLVTPYLLKHNVIDERVLEVTTLYGLQQSLNRNRIRDRGAQSNLCQLLTVILHDMDPKYALHSAPPQEIEEKEEPKIKEKCEKWSCSICTFENEGEHLGCYMCGRPRGSKRQPED